MSARIGGTATRKLRSSSAVALQAASNRMLPQMVGGLNAAGITPILSLDNRLAASSKGLPAAVPPCALPEDTVLTALEGKTWVRFYENWCV